MAVLIEHPLFALLPAMIFLGIYRVTRRRLILAAALAWLLYLPYEYGMKLRILCSGECNIRVDLLLLYPALLVISVVSIAVFAIALWKREHP